MLEARELNLSLLGALVRLIPKVAGTPTAAHLSPIRAPLHRPQASHKDANCPLLVVLPTVFHSFQLCSVTGGPPLRVQWPSSSMQNISSSANSQASSFASIFFMHMAMGLGLLPPPLHRPCSGSRLLHPPGGPGLFVVLSTLSHFS